MVDILNPLYVINELFGNLYLFLAIGLIAWFYIAARYRLNIQLTMLISVASFLLITTLQLGFSVWLGFVVALLGMFLIYVFWRYLSN